MVGRDEDGDARSLSLRQQLIQVPNLLTLFRIAAIPLVIYLLLFQTPRGCFAAAMVYILSAVTDALDGYLARRMGLNSLLGKFLDPLADKLLVATLLIYLVGMDWVPAWAAALTLVRELSVTSLRALASSEGLVLAAQRGGKEKTALQMVALMMLILHYRYWLDFGFLRVEASFHAVGLILLYFSLALGLHSAWGYLKGFESYDNAR